MDALSGHNGGEENEISDAFANEGSIFRTAGPELSVILVIAVIRNIELVSHNSRWQSINVARRTNLFLSEPKEHTGRLSCAKVGRHTGIFLAFTSLTNVQYRSICQSSNEQVEPMKDFLCEYRASDFGTDIFQLQKKSVTSANRTYVNKLKMVV